MIKNLASYILVFIITVSLFPSELFAQDEPTNTQIVDSLFMRASSGMVMYRDEVEPSKKALIDMGEAAIPRMLTKLNTRGAREMHTINDIFKGIGEIAVEPLAGRLTSRDDYVRRLAIRCMGEIKSPKAIEHLKPYAEHDDFRTRAGIMRAMGLIGNSQASQIVIDGLFDTDELVATAAAVACGKIKQGIDPVALIEVFDHPYYGVRYCAMKSLAELGEKSIEPLKLYIKSKPDDLSLGFAIEALGKTGLKKAIGILKQTIKSEKWAIRAFTAQALGDINSGKSKKILKKVLKTESHPLVINNAKMSLAKLQEN
ncbi:MAG: HEAT repeat domain-containing protein [candidate division Zixibacteria bacterium]|nr:HEAT repeat domain-containing protein [candidate division Zixibacteria bacterium]